MDDAAQGALNRIYIPDLILGCFRPSVLRLKLVNFLLPVTRFASRIARVPPHIASAVVAATLMEPSQAAGDVEDKEDDSQGTHADYCPNVQEGHDVIRHAVSSFS